MARRVSGLKKGREIMRKFLTSLLALAMLLSLLGVTAMAAEGGAGLAVTATLEGKTVTVEVIATERLTNGGLTLGYDSEVLTFVSAEAKGTVSAVDAGAAGDVAVAAVDGGVMVLDTNRAAGNAVTLVFASESGKAAKAGDTVATASFTYRDRVVDTEITVTMDDLGAKEGLHLALPTVSLSASLPFTDVSRDAWYYDAVKYAYNKGILKGVTETIFQPEGAMTRAMFVTVLARMDGVADDPHAKTHFNDVKDGNYYAGAVAWAFENDIVEGTSKKTFSPNARITREEMVTMLFRYAGYLGQDTDADVKILKDFPDGNRVNGWAKEAMAWAVEQGIVRGTEKGLQPRATATRAQGAQVLMNFALLED